MTAVQRPLVSAIVPAYNAGPFLAESIESILAQTYRPVEIVVVNNGSSDDTLAVAERFGSRVRLYSLPEPGVGAARNLAIAEARGALLALQDADDIADPRRFDRQAAALEADPALDIVFGHIVQFRKDAGGVVSVREAQPGCLPGVMMVRRSSFDRVGFFDPSLPVAELLPWLIRARGIGLREAMLPEVLLHRRIHDDNLGRRAADARGPYLRSLKAAIEFRRAAAKTGPR